MNIAGKHVEKVVSLTLNNKREATEEIKARCMYNWDEMPLTL